MTTSSLLLPSPQLGTHWATVHRTEQGALLGGDWLMPARAADALDHFRCQVQPSNTSSRLRLSASTRVITRPTDLHVIRMSSATNDFDVSVASHAT